MATQSARQWGVTPAISTALPTDSELAANDALVAELKRQNNFESPEATEKRKIALQTIQRATTEFVRQVSKKKGLSQAAIDAAGGKIFTYGSYRLGVYGPGSDIDTLVVVPRHVFREDFFAEFPSVLERMSSPGAIEEMTPVPDAYVPIIKLEYCGISIDLIFGRLATPSVPQTLDLKDKNLLRGVEERDLRSLNGTRVTDEILELVPQQKTFRHALRGIKLWAQRRAIYGNVMGFPGGVAWAMMVARVCQLYPQATGSVLIGKFFRIMGKWQWPQPVLLKPIEDGPLQARVWNPKVYNGDRFHLMPIITPAYPSMCATHNVTMSTKEIIQKEMQRGGDIVDKIFLGQMQWKDLFVRHEFFTHGYKYYLSVVATSKSKDSQHIWSGLVESKVRHLVTGLDAQDAIKTAHPYVKGFERVHHCKNDDQCEAVSNGDLQYQVTGIKTQTTDSTNDPKHTAAAQAGSEDLQTPNANGNGVANGTEERIVYTTTYYVGIELHTGDYDLPADVFELGETPPSRPKKKLIKKSDLEAAAKAKKRSFEASELQIGRLTRESREGIREEDFQDTRTEGLECLQKISEVERGLDSIKGYDVGQPPTPTDTPTSTTFDMTWDTSDLFAFSPLNFRTPQNDPLKTPTRRSRGPSNKKKLSSAQEPAKKSTPRKQTSKSSKSTTKNYLQTPPPTSSSAARRKAQQEFTLKLVQASAAKGLRGPPSPVMQKDQPHPETEPTSVEESPQQFGNLQFSPDVYNFPMSGSMTAPPLPQERLFWDSNMGSTGESTGFPSVYADPFVTSSVGLNSLQAPTTSSFSGRYDMENGLRTPDFMRTPSSLSFNTPSFPIMAASPVVANFRKESLDQSLFMSSPARRLGPPSMLDQSFPSASVRHIYAGQGQEQRYDQTYQQHQELQSVPLPHGQFFNQDRHAAKRRVTDAASALGSSKKTQASMLSRSNTLHPSRARPSSRRVSPSKSDRHPLPPFSRTRTEVSFIIDEAGRAKTITEIVPIEDEEAETDFEEAVSESEFSDDPMATSRNSFTFPRRGMRKKRLPRYVSDSGTHSKRSSFSSGLGNSSSAGDSISSRRILRPSRNTSHPLGHLSSNGCPENEAEAFVESDEDAAEGDALTALARERESHKQGMSFIGNQLLNPLQGQSINSYHQPPRPHSAASPTTITDHDLSVSPAISLSAATPNSTTRCICNRQGNDDLMIQCESCFKWLHAKCIGIDERNVPKVFVCIYCTGQTPMARNGRIRGLPSRAQTPSPLTGRRGRCR
ncbi:MAG: hypothetical protein M1834_000152 [Cirrosporium novae-zelandiae]|nr:MAG: hypothetical protein M1834_000152 [Cirrosporium novae-zelandiae]